MLADEKNLIDRAKAGDIECFAKLYDHYLERIYRFLYVKTNHREEAEDLTHEVFLSAWQNLGRYTHQGFPFSSWLYQMARNRVIDHYRLKRNHVRVEDAGPDAAWAREENTLSHEVDVALAMGQVRSLLKELTEDQQDVILLRAMEELSYPEIAKALGKSEGAVRLIHHRAIQELRRRMTND